MALFSNLSLAGDVTGLSSANTVAQLQGQPVSGTSVTKGQLFAGTAAGTYGPVSVSGDVGFSAVTAGLTTVTGLQGIAVPTPTGTGTVLTYSSGAYTWGAGGGGGGVSWANDLAGSTSTSQYVVGISGSGGTAGTITLGDGTHNLALTGVASLQSTPPTMTITSSGGFSTSASAGSAAGAAIYGAGSGGAGQGTNQLGGVGASATLKGGGGGAATGTAANSTGGAAIIASGVAGTGGSGTAGAPGAINFLVGATDVLDIVSTTSMVPHTDNALIFGTAALRVANVNAALFTGYPSVSAANASIQLIANGPAQSTANVSGGGMITFSPGASGAADIYIAHTTNVQEICIQDQFQDTCMTFTSGGTPSVTLGCANFYFYGVQGLASATNANVAFSYPAQASTSGTSVVGGAISFRSQPGQGNSTAKTAGAGGAATYAAAAGGTVTVTGSSSAAIGGAGGITTIGGDAGGAATIDTAGTGGKGGSIVALAGIGGNGGATTGTSGAGGDFTFGTSGPGTTGNTKGGNGTLTMKVGGASVLTWLTTPNWASAAVTLAASGATTITAAQYLLPVITLGTVTTTANTTLAFPNIAGVWLLDLTALTIGATFTFAVTSGSGSSPTVTSVTTTQWLWTVKTNGANGISINL